MLTNGVYIEKYFCYTPLFMLSGPVWGYFEHDNMYIPQR